MRIFDLREKNGITQSDLAKKLGIARSTLSQYENGKRQPDQEMLFKIASVFDVSIDYLLGFSSDSLRPLDEPITVGGKIKVLGKVPAGVAIEAIEYVIDEIDISEKMARDGNEYFGLLVSGDSMYPEYLDGDIVIIRKQPTATTGDDVVAYVNGYDATIKRIVRSDMGITLRALNPAYESKTYSNEEIENLPVVIAGIVVEQRRRRNR